MAVDDLTADQKLLAIHQFRLQLNQILRKAIDEDQGLDIADQDLSEWKERAVQWLTEHKSHFDADRIAYISPHGFTGSPIREFQEEISRYDDYPAMIASHEYSHAGFPLSFTSGLFDNDTLFISSTSTM